MRSAIVAVVLVAGLAWAAPATQAQSSLAKDLQARSGSNAAGVTALDAQKIAIAREVLRAREQAQGRGPFDAPTTQYWMGRLTSLSLDRLLAIAGAGPGADLTRLVSSAAGATLADGVSPDLGDSARDLVFTMVTPCRVADTRVAGGALANASQRNFYVAGTSSARFTPQGGVACGIPIGATSVAANITVTQAAGWGWLRAWPYGSSGTASIINYFGGDTIANGLILPICDPAAANCSAADLTIRADAAGTHVLIDVMGYFQRVNKDNYRSTTITQYVGHLGGVTWPLSGTCQNLTPVSVTVPGAGQIVVEATVNSSLNHSTSLTEDSEIDWVIAEAADDCDISLLAHRTGLDAAYALVPDVYPSGIYLFPSSAKYVRTVGAAGTYVFYVNALWRSGVGTGTILDVGATATFHPQ